MKLVEDHVNHFKLYTIKIQMPPFLISLFQIKKGSVHLIEEQTSLSQDDLMKETARLFMFSKVGNIVENAMRQGIKVALKNGDAKEQNGRIGIG